MAVFRATDGYNQTNGSSPLAVDVLNWPAGTVTGDVVFWHIVITAASGGAPTWDGIAPSGWTLRADVSSGRTRLVILSHPYTSGDALPTSIVFSSTDGSTLNHRNNYTSYSSVTTVGTAQTASGASGNGSVTGLTPRGGASGLLLTFFGNQGITLATPPSGATERGDQGAVVAPSSSLNDEPLSTISTTESNTFATTTSPWVAAAIPLDASGALVGATLTGVTFPLRHAGVGPFISSAGNVYFFGRNTSGGVGTVSAYKASDPMGGSFAVPGTIAKTMSSATTTAIEAMACYQVGQVIHVVTQIATGAVYYNSYTMDTDTWALSPSETAVAAASFAPVTGTSFVSIVVRSNGNAVIVYNAGQTAMATAFNMVRYRERTGTNTYGTATQVDNGGSVDWEGGVAALGASNRIHIFFDNITAGTLIQRTLSAANALQTFPSGVGSGATAISSSVVASYASGANIQAISPMQNGSVAYITSADAPTPSTALARDAAQTGVLGVNGQRIANVVHDGTLLHYLFSASSNSDLYHDTSTNNGATWGTDVNELAGTINRITSNVYTRSGTEYLAMVLDDNATVRYVEIEIPVTPVAVHRRLISKAAVIRNTRY